MSPENHQNKRQSANHMADTRRAHVLVVEDSELDTSMLCDVIEEFCTVTITPTAKEALAMLEEKDFDLVLLDIMLPDMDGFELCRAIRQLNKTKNMPIIFITSLDDVGSEEHGLRMGASDYITKPFAPAVIRVRIKNQIELYRYAREIRKTNQQLSLLAATDDLTGVFNRRQFRQLANDILHKDDDPCCFLMMDLDHFKSINDGFGHDAGDAVLVSTTKAWGEILRTEDLLGRVGGEEFAVLLPDTSLEQGSMIAERIRSRTEQTIISTSGHILNATISIGLYYSDHGTEGLEEMQKKADIALYDAKKSGRNCVKVSAACATTIKP